MTDNTHTFPGFPNGRLRFAAVPDVFFSELLPAIDDLAELKLTLHVIWRLQRLEREPRCLALSELRADGTLLAGLDPGGVRPQEALAEALARAVTRGTLLRLEDAAGDGAWFFLNSQQGRQGFERAVRGELRLPGGEAEGELRLASQRPNIYQLYQQNIGLLQPLIADQLRDAEATYPAEWIEEAFCIAVERNVRNWRYVRGILERWEREGKDSGARASGDRRRYIRGKYGDRIAH
jgi:DNA replication protein